MPRLARGLFASLRLHLLLQRLHGKPLTQKGIIPGWIRQKGLLSRPMDLSLWTLRAKVLSRMTGAPRGPSRWGLPCCQVWIRLRPCHRPLILRALQPGSLQGRRVDYVPSARKLPSLMLAPPCTTFSAAAHPAVRSYDRPEGFCRTNEKTRLGNRLAFMSFAIFWLPLGWLPLGWELLCCWKIPASLRWPGHVAGNT